MSAENGEQANEPSPPTLPALEFDHSGPTQAVARNFLPDPYSSSVRSTYDKSSSEDDDSYMESASLEDQFHDVSLPEPPDGIPIDPDAEPLLGSTNYASRRLLCPWLPEADPDIKRSLRRCHGLAPRQSVLISACTISLLVFITNVAIAAYLPTHYSDARLFTGDCATANRLDSGLHVIINILSSLLLGASNLCIQLLSAPTRNEVDKAHKQKIWLDIGIPSILRNFKYIATGRKIAIMILALSSLPLHLLWNSSIIIVQPENAYWWSVVTPGFVNGARWNFNESVHSVLARQYIHVTGRDNSGDLKKHYLQVPDSSLYRPPYASGYNSIPKWPWKQYGPYLSALQERMVGLTEDQIQDNLHFTNLSTLDCLTRYLSYTRDASNLLMISSQDVVVPSNEVLEGNNSLLVSGWYGSRWESVSWPVPPWECGYSNNFSCVRPSTWAGDESMVSAWNVYGYKVDYCLSSTVNLDNKCSIRFELPILIIICAANLCKCLCICYTVAQYWGSRNVPLSTMGDAAVSFLSNPDEYTKGMSLADRTNVDALWEHRSARRWTPTRHRWYMVTSKRSWLLTIALSLTILLVAAVLTGFEIYTVKGELGTIHFNIAKLGFGRANVYEPVGFLHHDLTSGILFANCWQVLVSLLYVQVNALVTAFLVGDEWCRFDCAQLNDEAASITAREEKELFSSSVVSLPLERSRGLKETPNKLSLLSAKIWLRLRTLHEMLTQCSYQVHRSIGIPEKRRVRVRKTLRVTAPDGIQRSSYFVSMPWKYGIPLMSMMSMLHWLISQSVFVYASDLFKGDGTRYKDVPLITGTGFSLESTICALALGLVFVIVLVLLGLRRYPIGTPLASSCSAAISAACQRPAEDEDAHLFPIYWGVVSEHEGVGHCSLTTARNVLPLQVGKLYA